MLFMFVCPVVCNAAITEAQGNDLADYASKFIEEGNKRKDDFFVMKQMRPGMRNLIITDC